MGGVYGAGFQDGLLEYIKKDKWLTEQVKITLVAHFDPYDGGFITANPDIYTEDFLHQQDYDNDENALRKDSDGNGWLASGRVKGANFFREDENEAAHGIEYFGNDIKNLHEGIYKWDGNSWKCENCK